MIINIVPLVRSRSLQSMTKKNWMQPIPLLIFSDSPRSVFKISSYIDVGDKLMLVTIFGCLWQNFDIGDIFWMLVPDADAKRCW